MTTNYEELTSENVKSLFEKLLIYLRDENYIEKTYEKEVKQNRGEQ